MTIVEFITARLDDDEAVARRNSFVLDHMGSEILVWESDAAGMPTLAISPARVLRECAAKREILAECAEILDFKLGWEYDDTPELARHTVNSLAQVWSDHPDFDPAWA